MNTLAHSGIFWAGLIAGLVLIYFLPTMIGIIRKVESLGLLIFLNVLPTGVGWFAAMVMAFMLPRREPPPTYRPASTLRSISRCNEASFWLLKPRRAGWVTRAEQQR
jgi:Superinfection immunity protein